MKPTDIVAVGTAYIDINCPEFPFSEDGFSVETETVGGKYETVLGGSGLNFCKLCTRLGLETTFVGKVGADTTGQQIRQLMDKAHIQPALIEDEKVSSNIAMNVINNQGQFIGLIAGTANKRLTEDELVSTVTKLLPKAKYLYLSSCFKMRRLTTAFVELAKAANAAGVTVIVDHGRIVNGVSRMEMSAMKWLVENADYYLPSRDEFMQLWHVQTIVEGLELMVDNCRGQTIVKDGAGGAICMVDGRAIRVPAFQVTPLNTVGAGDSFNAGFIAAHHRGMGIEDSMRFGCAAAALKISQAKLPTLAELELLHAS